MADAFFPVWNHKTVIGMAASTTTEAAAAAASASTVAAATEVWYCLLHRRAFNNMIEHIQHLTTFYFSYKVV